MSVQCEVLSCNHKFAVFCHIMYLDIQARLDVLAFHRALLKQKSKNHFYNLIITFPLCQRPADQWVVQQHVARQRVLNTVTAIDRKRKYMKRSVTPVLVLLWSVKTSAVKRPITKLFTISWYDSLKMGPLLLILGPCFQLKYSFKNTSFTTQQV